jgi:hypothetical protein
MASTQQRKPEGSKQTLPLRLSDSDVFRSSGVCRGTPCYRNAPQAACTLVRDAFKQSTESRPASIALIVQRRAAIQNCCLCPVQQNFWLDPPVVRSVKVRSHHRQHASEVGFCAGSSAVRTRPLLEFTVMAAAGIGEFGDWVTDSKVSTIQPIYRYNVTSATSATRFLNELVRHRLDWSP